MITKADLEKVAATIEFVYGGDRKYGTEAQALLDGILSLVRDAMVPPTE